MENANVLQTASMHRRVLKLMGNRFEITVVSDDAAWAQERINDAIAEIQRIERLLTTFNEDSETNRINRYAGIMPVKVSAEIIALIQRATRISRLTQGAFDITYGAVNKSLWNFDTHMNALPDAATARKMVRLINFRNVIVDEAGGTVFLKEKGMRIGFGGIGKGYAAECAKSLLQRLGVTSGIVNAAGDLTVWGRQPDGQPWTVGIANPDQANRLFSSLQLSDMALATSGNYEKYVFINGKRYSHTIDPRTGLPVSGIKSVSILCPNAEIADALTTPVMIMGIRAGLDMINQINGIGCIIIDDNNQIFTSQNIRIK
ncbi:thiamine biosynthesis lipoprotein [Chitinophaga rupis]|uniref:FAD:protein FMN transferase n=1 Tax=Chitinophaga rupis TaxID=573321 RepID=A0A1H7PVA8_9BACT|nr:FAD:protein FMN transferase [Chitinophaga rupis]SEL39007.1 thiamine biosynthesis lipoprotein [Chitinophaga rupis]